jgi:hypothetical protein
VATGRPLPDTQQYRCCGFFKRGKMGIVFAGLANAEVAKKRATSAARKIFADETPTPTEFMNKESK